MSMKQYSYLTVDDNEDMSTGIVYKMAKYNEFEFSRHFSVPEEALNFLKMRKCDLLFLDVQMPKIDGFQLLEKLQNPPLTVIVTGYPNIYSERAHRYYDMNVIDFISKVCTEERFDIAINRFKKKMLIIKIIENHQHLLNNSTYLTVKHPLSNESVNLDILDITHIKQIENYSYIHTRNKDCYSKRISLIKFQTLLPENATLLIGRNCLIMRHQVCSYNALTVNLGRDIDGNEIILPISPTKRTEVESILH
ncbi:MAG: response regulator [Bacteroidales bacterium]